MNAQLSAKRPRHIQVQSWYDVNPYLRRIIFYSPELVDYPFQFNGAHIKILLPLPHQDKPILPESTPQGPRWADKASKPISRTYTLRHYCAQENTVAIDFVLHGDDGPASYFAHHVQIGQTIGISPPVGPNPMLKRAQHYVLIGDLSALPAISALLEDMPAEAQGMVLLFLPDDAAQLVDIALPHNVQIRYFYGRPTEYAALYAIAIQCRPPSDDCFIWLAGEAGLVAQLRRLVRHDWQIPAAQCYAVPYWRLGENEESYHRKRHDFMDNAD